MADTSIEWTTSCIAGKPVKGKAWNATTGCNDDVISPGCERCYARRAAHHPRLRGKFGYPKDEPFRVTLHPDRLDAPLHWRKPRRVFVDSMGDLFHDDVPLAFIAEVFGVMAVAHVPFMCGKETRRKARPSEKYPRGATVVSMPKTSYGPHTFMVLTKRPGRARDLLTNTRFRGLVAAAAYRHAHNRTDAGYLSHQIGTSEEYGRCYDPGRLWPLPNVYLGVTAEDQQRADERIPLLLQTPAAVRFVSVEPMLEDVDVFARTDRIELPYSPPDWVICGAETGPGARTMDLDWARSLLDQCRAAGVPFFFKSAGPGIATPPDLAVREWPEVRRGQ